MKYQVDVREWLLLLLYTLAWLAPVLAVGAVCLVFAFRCG